MAKIEVQLTGDFDTIIEEITDEILRKSMSAELEAASDFAGGTSRCSVRVFERYSMIGSNRVSLNITLFETDTQLQLSAIASGGSQAMFFKVNTFGEEAFLEELHPIIKKYQID